MFFFIENQNAKVKVELVFKKDSNTCNILNGLRDNNLFDFEVGNTYLSLEPETLSGYIFLGLGKADYEKEDLIQAGFNLYNKLLSLKLKNVYLDFSQILDTLKDRKDLLYFFEGLYHATYKFDKYLTIKEERNITFEISNEFLDLANDLDELKYLMHSNFETRDFINTPAIDLNPEIYANKIKESLKDLPIEVTIFDEKQMLENNMHAALAVGMGSVNKPRFVILKYQPNKDSDEFIGLVGKGICYDSGGYAIKPDYAMVTMKRDMSGSATVYGALKAIALNKIKQNVVVTMALCENLVSGSAYKNGDIISSMKGLTIEVNNTDAEGRVSMADSLYYIATKFNTKKIVEISTLTGAVKVALGFDTAGAISFNQDLYNKLYETSKEVYEPIWQLPITQRSKNYVKGKFGDLSNSCPGPGAITAGVFLSHFVEDKPFVHLDIAGTAYDSANKYYNEGATGFGVKLLYNFIKKQAKE